MAEGPLELARRRIAAASDEVTLHAAAEQAHDAVRKVIAARSGATSVAPAWSGLLRTALAVAAQVTGASDGSWYVSGSAGRGDALPGSDVETLFVRPTDTPPERALAHAAAVHDLLEACGFRGDANGAVAARARFNRSAREWADAIDRWTGDAAADRGVVMIGLLADAVPVVTTGIDLREDVGIAARAHPPALAAILQDSTNARAFVPSRLRVLARGDSSVDVKHAAVDPVVRIARWAALSCGSHALPTMDRISEAAGTRYLDVDDARTLAKCHSIGSSIRWRARASSWDTTGFTDDHLNLADLPPQDRTALRSIGRELTGVRRKLDYLASTSTFSQW